MLFCGPGEFGDPTIDQPLAGREAGDMSLPAAAHPGSRLDEVARCFSKNPELSDKFAGGLVIRLDGLAAKQTVASTTPATHKVDATKIRGLEMPGWKTVFFRIADFT
jgi:hypothetical protein